MFPGALNISRLISALISTFILRVDDVAVEESSNTVTLESSGNIDKENVIIVNMYD
jgi:hypothetical protein